MKSFLVLAILLTVVCVSVSASGAIWWYVDGSVSSSGDGTTWETAFKTIQEGIDAASDGDTVTVGQGTYVENVTFKGKNIVLTGTDPLDPTSVANTIIDGNKAGPVVTFSGTETETCVLSGFTIRNGKAFVALAEGGGLLGGTHSWGTRATIEDNTITANSATGSGGGLALCNGTIQNNMITGNQADYGGGLYECSGTIQNNTITDNSARDGAGLAQCYAIIQNNTIAGNRTQHGSSGGLYWCGGIIQNNVITGNSAEGDGGGLNLCNGTIRSNIITGNSAGHNGGGLHDSGATIQNNLITGNTATYDGGGLWGCRGAIQNNTVTNNSANSGGGLACCKGPGSIQNCIVWGNTAPTGPQVYDSSVPSFSCIEGWTEGGEGNVVSDPHLVDSDGTDNDPETFGDNDYRLLPDSPCIDAGMNDDWMSEAVDLDGNKRIIYGGASLTVDIGAYEFQSFPVAIAQIAMEAANQVRLTWFSRAGDTCVVWSCADLSRAEWVELAIVTAQSEMTSWTESATIGRVRLYRVEMK